MSRHPRANDDTEQGFLRRWSRRKRRPDDGVTEPDEPGSSRSGAARVDPPAGSQEAPAAEADEPVKTDEDMPELETIDATTDMSDFFSPGVSEQLRNQALRRLFHLSKFNVMDGLDDYCENFRDFQPLGDLVTADMRHRMEVEKQRLAQAEEEAADEQTASQEDTEASPADEEAGADTEIADADQAEGDTDPESRSGGDHESRT